MVLDWYLGFLSVFLSCNYCRAFSYNYAEMLNGAEATFTFSEKGAKECSTVTIR
jgi:hypothetical protein